MKNGVSKVVDVLLWVFVAFCLLMAIGMGFGAGCIMMIITAILAMPIKPIRNLWNMVLGVKEIAEVDEPAAKWWEVKKKKAQRQRQTEKENQKSRKTLKPLIIAVVFIIAFCLGMGQMESTTPSDGSDPVLESSSIVADETTDESTSTSEVATEENSESEAPTETKTPVEESTATTEESTAATEESTVETTVPTEEPKQPELSDPTSNGFDLSTVPAYSGSAYVVVNNNNPYFTEADYTTTSFEYYSDFDSLGRCGVVYASIGKDLMPTEERGSIGQVKPTGWQTVKYDIVDGKYLYNRCHLIGYQLSGENANTKNLITGTRYLNIEGMLPFENMVADYVQETNNHVMYRVTPIFEGNNLLATGVLMEAYSVEDGGDGICFNVFCYNAQPGISIDYSNGSSSLIATETKTEPDPEPTTSVSTEPTTSEPENSGTTYILNTNTKKFHYPSCSSVDQMSEKNKKEYTGDRDDLIDDGYEPCKRCNP